MKTQNNIKNELRKKPRGLFLLGLLTALSLTLMAFEWAVFDMNYSSPNEPEIVEEILEIELPEEVELEKPKPKKIIQQEEFNPLVHDTFQIRDYDTVVAMNPLTDTLITDIIPIKPIDDDGGRGPIIDEVFTVVEKMPSFPGGEAELYKFLGSNIKYPRQAIETNAQGRVFVQFVVEKDGSITGVKVVRGIGSGCDKESVRVVTKMPKWTPGEQRGKPVRVKYTLPIVYTLK